MSAEVELAYRLALEESVRAGDQILRAGGSSLDAVVAAVSVMEDSELFNAGKGAVLTHEGDVELDASIMEGAGLEAGALAGVKHIKNPVQLAAEILHHSEHVMLIGKGAEEFARERQFTLTNNDYFITARRIKQLERVQSFSKTTALSEDTTDAWAEESTDVLSANTTSANKMEAEGGNSFSASLDASEEKKLGTVGAVAIDRRGTLAAATSTGGMTNKQYGRVGDSPIIGAGTFADNHTGAVSATGHGEYFMRAVVAHDICARVRYKNISLQQAADEVVHDRLTRMGGDGGVVAIDPEANVVFSFNSEGMYRAVIHKDGELEVAIFKDQGTSD